MDLVDNVERCPQSHSLHHHQPGEFCWMEREERLRLSWIEAYRELQDAGSVCRRFGISRPTLRKWLRRFEADGAAGLCTQSRAPHRSPSTKVGPDEEALILELRRTRCLGVKRLRHELRRLYWLQLSPATIHKTLVRHALNVLPRRKRTDTSHGATADRRSGDRVQMDTCKIRPGLYQFTAIDDCTRYLVAGLARRRTAAATLAFLDQVLDEMPFAIQRLQTDRGAEFFAEDVQRRLMAEAIRFRPIPPRSPHLNGKVERVQRTVLEEFWPTVDVKAPEIADRLAEWVHYYNWDRQHEALNGSTPIDRVCERASKIPLHGEVSDAYEPANEHIQVREHAVETTLRSLKRCP
jgi:transposase InsO family protein